MTLDPLAAGRVDRLAGLLVDARLARVSLTVLAADLLPVDADEADAVQEATAARIGAIGAFKVAQVGDGPGSWGAIFAADVFAAPAVLEAVGRPLRVEVEVAFRLGRDLPGRADGALYGRDEVADAIADAFCAFELIASRLPAEPKPAAVVARADAMSNWGLVHGAARADWRGLMRDDLAARLEIGGKVVVDRRGGHPSGDPFHPVVWLANALAARGRGLKAGNLVTTGSFGGSHPFVAGDTARGEIEGFASIDCRFVG